jgi:glucans biosynthesis protein C
VLALITWVVRWWYPVDDWVPLFGVLAAEPAHLPQYVILFALGVVAYLGDWLGRMPAHLGAIWLALGPDGVGDDVWAAGCGARSLG